MLFIAALVCIFHEHSIRFGAKSVLHSLEGLGGLRLKDLDGYGTKFREEMQSRPLGPGPGHGPALAYALPPQYSFPRISEFVNLQPCSPCFPIAVIFNPYL